MQAPLLVPGASCPSTPCLQRFPIVVQHSREMNLLRSGTRIISHFPRFYGPDRAPLPPDLCVQSPDLLSSARQSTDAPGHVFSLCRLTQCENLLLLAELEEMAPDIAPSLPLLIDAGRHVSTSAFAAAGAAGGHLARLSRFIVVFSLTSLPRLVRTGSSGKVHSLALLIAGSWSLHCVSAHRLHLRERSRNWTTAGQPGGWRV
jgi:hypothetical protein